MANVTLPKLTDYLTNHSVINWARIFVDPWLNLFGSFFWGVIICVFGMVIFLKTERIEPMIAWFILTAALGGVLFPDGLLYLLGITAGIVVGFLLYRVFISTKE